MADLTYARQQITAVARLYDGSHYLWGADGSQPGHMDGIKRPLQLVNWDETSLDPASPSVFAAKCDTQGHYVCAGRYRKIPGGRQARSSDWDLANYLARLKELHPSLWEPYFTHFTPRVIRGSNVDDKGKIVWGEDCSGRRHFDCISFINFVLTKTTVLSKDKSGNELAWSHDIGQWYDLTTRLKLEDPVMPSDILFRGHPVNESDPKSKMHWDHIAFLDENGNVIQAEEAVMGVHWDESYVPSRWTARGRLPTSMLRG